MKNKNVKDLRRPKTRRKPKVIKKQTEPEIQVGTRLWDASTSYLVVRIRKVGYGLLDQTSNEIFPFYRKLELIRSYCQDHRIVRREK